MENNDMKQVEQRVKRYWYADGIAEIASGGMFLLLGLYFGVLGYFEEGSLVSVILQVSMVLVMIGGAFGVRWLVNTLKSRLTYPRTGYVEYRVNEKDAKQRRWIVVAVAIIVASASILLVDYIRGLDSMVLITGVLVGIIFIALRGKSSGLKRFYALGGLAIVMGIALAYSNLSQVYTLSLFYGLLGIAILISGGLVLRSYLQENPPPSENDYE
ncbi:MAG: hypothetical protein JW963_25680 [Anaerolineales bacterium]|nr:hypothetical protein [Anaerolineales bacterium]